MGSSRWDDRDWAAHSSTTSTKSREEIFTSKVMADDLNPLTIKIRESRDSDKNPRSTPIILASDVTGSMGRLAEQIIKNDLHVVMKGIYDKKPVTDPHVMVMAVGDCECKPEPDEAPLQCTQFEAGVKEIVPQIAKLWLEGGGGGNEGETYILAWLFATLKIKADAFTKRKEKGFIFTIGDEPPVMKLTKANLRRFIDPEAEKDITAEALLDQVRKHWHVFHVIVKPLGNHVIEAWKDLLGQHVIVLPDTKSMAEVIVSTMQAVAGHSHDDIAKGWDGTTAITVRDAIKNIAPVKGGKGSKKLATL